MRRIGETRTLQREGEVERAYDLDYLRSLPPTATLEAHHQQLQLDVRSMQQEAKKDPPRYLLMDLERTAATLAAAQQRDRLQAGRPADCWCFGEGGRGPRSVVVPEAEGVVLADRDGTERRAFGPEDIVTLLSAYCGCPEGLARRERDDELRDRVSEGYRTRRQERQIAAIWEGIGIPDRYAACTLDSYPQTTAGQRTAVTKIRAWLASDQWALVLCGDFGVGKSGLAAGILRDAADRQQPGLFCKTADVWDRWKATFRRDAETSAQEVLASLRTVPYLVLDDLGVDISTDFVKTALYQVLDDRHGHSRKTVITTNLDVKKLAVHLGERTMRRFEEGTVIHTVDGPNLRLVRAA